jgi:hypothetical protein
MTLSALLSTLHAAGVALTLDAGALRYRAPKGVMTPDLLQQLAEYKAALLDLLEAFEERAAIMEYEGGLSQEEAERLAWACVLDEPQPYSGARCNPAA